MTTDPAPHSGHLRRPLRRLMAGLAVVSVASLSACGGSGYTGGSSSEEFAPEDLTLIAAGDPGGGLDIQARVFSDSVRKGGVTDANIQVENLGGGGGNAARAKLLKGQPDGESVVVESNRIFLAPMTDTTDMAMDDFTPLAKLTTEYLVWAVRADSPYKSAKQVLDTVKKDPKAVSFGVGTVPSDDQLNILQASESAGVKDLKALNLVAFDSGGDLATKLLGGHVDVISTGLSEIAEQVEAGKVRLLAISAEQPQGGLAEGVPTWKQVGIGTSLDHWRAVFGPADMSDEARTWWVSTLRKATKTPEWKKQVEQMHLTTDFETGQQFLDETIDPQQQEYEKLLSKVGLVHQE